MKKITKDKVTAGLLIFFVLWLTVGSIVCLNVSWDRRDLPICTPMFAIFLLYIFAMFFASFSPILVNLVFIATALILYFFVYKSVFQHEKYANSALCMIFIIDMVSSLFIGLIFLVALQYLSDYEMFGMLFNLFGFAVKLGIVIVSVQRN